MSGMEPDSLNVWFLKVLDLSKSHHSCEKPKDGLVLFYRIKLKSPFMQLSIRPQIHQYAHSISYSLLLTSDLLKE